MYKDENGAYSPWRSLNAEIIPLLDLDIYLKLANPPSPEVQIHFTPFLPNCPVSGIVVIDRMSIWTFSQQPRPLLPKMPRLVHPGLCRIDCQSCSDVYIDSTKWYAYFILMLEQILRNYGH